MKPLGAVKFDDDCNKACRANNADIVSRAEDEPAEGGNCEKLAQINGEARLAKAKEASYFGYSGASAEEFVALLLIKDFDKHAALAKAAEEDKEKNGTELP